MADEFIYRITRHRPNPSFYKSKVQTGLHSKRSLSAILNHIKEINDHVRWMKERYGDNYNGKPIVPSEVIVKIERGRIADFEDVTRDYVPDLPSP
jgi:hypothetical protein